MSTVDDPDEQGTGRARSVVLWALATAFSVGAAYLLYAADFLKRFSVYGDDAGVVLNSADPWFAYGRWVEWFTRGFSRYAVNYPDWQPFANNTLKPVVNLAFRLEAGLEPVVGQAAYMVVSYLAPAVTAGVLVVVFVRMTSVRPHIAALFAAGMATAACWYGSLFGAVDIVNTLAFLFSACAIAVLPLGKPASPWRMLLLVGFQLLAIFSHETAIVLPVVLGGLMLALATYRPRVRDAVPLILPPVVWAVERFFVLQADKSVYALQAESVLRLKSYLYFIVSAAVPFDVTGSWLARGLVPGGSPTVRLLTAASVVLLIAVNAVIIVVVVRALLRRRDRRALGMAVAIAAASVPHTFTAAGGASARFAGISMIVWLIALLWVSKERPRLLLVIGVGLLMANVLFMGSGLAERKARYVAEVEGAREFAAYVHDAVEAHEPDHVVVVNDRYGFFGVPAEIQLYAWPERGFDVVVINNLTTDDSRGGHVAVAQVGREIEIDVRGTRAGDITFLGAQHVDFARPNRGFRYTLHEGTLQAPVHFTARGPVRDGVTLVIGYDGVDGQLITPVRFE